MGRSLKSEPIQPRWKPDWIKLLSFSIWLARRSSLWGRGRIYSYPSSGKVQGVRWLCERSHRSWSGVYIVRFTDCRKKAAQTFSALDLSEILVLEKEEEVEEGEVAEQETNRANKAVAKIFESEAIMVGGPQEAATTPDA